MNAPIDVTNIRIETERLILRPWTDADLEDFFEYASVPGVGEMAGWCHHETRETTQQVLTMFITEKKVLALELKESHKVIGSLGIENVHPDPEPHKQGRELGYVLSKAYWGRGLMPEAVRAVIDYCFAVLHYDFLTCGHFVRNSQSRRVIEKCGFHFWKEVKHETRYDTVEGTLLYCLKRKEGSHA